MIWGFGIGPGASIPKMPSYSGAVWPSAKHGWPGKAIWSCASSHCFSRTTDHFNQPNMTESFVLWRKKSSNEIIFDTQLVELWLQWFAKQTCWNHSLRLKSRRSDALKHHDPAAGTATMFKEKRERKGPPWRHFLSKLAKHYSTVSILVYPIKTFKKNTNGRRNSNTCYIVVLQIYEGHVHPIESYLP